MPKCASKHTEESCLLQMWDANQFGRQSLVVWIACVVASKGGVMNALTRRSVGNRLPATKAAPSSVVMVRTKWLLCARAVTSRDQKLKNMTTTTACGSEPVGDTKCGSRRNQDGIASFDGME